MVDLQQSQKASDKFRVATMLILFIAAAFCFFWYSYRPWQIKKECGKVIGQVYDEASQHDPNPWYALQKALDKDYKNVSPSDLQLPYVICLNRHGI